MKKRLFLSLVAVLIISTLILFSTKVNALDWQDYLNLESNTEQCLTKCEAVFTITNPTSSSIGLLSNDVEIWNEIAKGSGLTKNIEIYKEEILNYNIEIPDYGTCYELINKNASSCSEINCQDYDTTYCNCSYSCQIGSHQEQRTKKEFEPFSFGGKTLEAGETWRIKLIGYKKASLEENNVEWLINFKGMQPPWDWWNSNWERKMPINVSVSSGSTDADYQISLNITYDSDMNNDFSDLRFINGSEDSELDYWIYNKSDGEWVYIWIEVDQNITTTNYTFYMYYNNSEASSNSNITNTFVWADDFSSDTWTSGLSSRYNISDGKLNACTRRYSGTRYNIYKALNSAYLNVSDKYELITLIRFVNNESGPYSMDGEFGLSDSSNPLSYYNSRYSGSWWGFMITQDNGNFNSFTSLAKNSGSDASTISSANLVAHNNWWYVNYRKNISLNQLYVYEPIDLSTIINTSNVTLASNLNFQYVQVSDEYASTTDEIATTQYDFIAIKKYHDPEPLTYKGDEEEYDSIPPTWSNNKTNASDETKTGEIVYFNITLEDNKAGGYYILSFDDGTGSFVNDTPATWTTPEEVQVIKTITAPRNTTVRWKWFFNDSTGNNNESDTWNFTVAWTWDIIFNVTNSYSGASLDAVIISCNYTLFDQAGDNTNTYGPYSFADGTWQCTFEKSPGYFNQTVIFIVNDDKTIPVPMSESGFMTIEEHTWLEELYNCIINGECEAFEMWESTNQTTWDIWKRVRRTDRSVITFENITNEVLNPPNQYITIDYTIEIPYKEGYDNNDLLPLRMFFWFHDGETCYNQDKTKDSDPWNRAESPFCFPLVAETLGPNNGSVNFTVTLNPDIPSGTYTEVNITRTIEIDPIFEGVRQWTNYGQEVIGTIKVIKSGDATIELENTGESYSDGHSITGNVIGTVKEFFTNNQVFVLILVGMICITVIIILNSYLKYKRRW